MYLPVVRSSNGPMSACALVGASSAILAWNVDDNFDKSHLLGFSVKRTDIDPLTDEIMRIDWLNGQKRFESVVSDLGVEVRSDQGPFQRFRWSDYTLNSNMRYVYEIRAMVGQPGSLQVGSKVTLEVQPSTFDGPDFSIYTNRGVTAAQAYLRRFGNQRPLEQDKPEIRAWLSRGLKESLLQFIGQAQAGDQVHVAIYEFHDHEVAEALKEAKSRGALVEIVCHGVNPEEKVVKHNVELLEHHGLRENAVLRTSVRISHNKFVVLLRDSVPKEVWTGSSNFTNNAFYLQTNTGIIVRHPEMAARYDAYFKLLRTNAPKSQTKRDNQALMEGFAPAEGVTSYFSPVKNLHIVEAVCDLIRSAKSAVFVSSPFGLDKQIMEALDANSEAIIEYGLANATAKKRIETLNRKNTRFFVPTSLKTYMGRDWDAKSFGKHKIHTKSLVIDPWGPSPQVLFGSANFSKPSCKDNDENAFLLTNHPRAAAIVSTEFIRMWDHYKSRSFINRIYKSGGQSKEAFLSNDPSWMNSSFDPHTLSHKYRDRIVFSGNE